MPLYLKLFAASLFLLCSACASLDKEECQVANWEQIGFTDGSKGRLAGVRLDKHTSACYKHNIIPDEPLYTRGHVRGVFQYCRPEQGFKLGEAGKEYNNICPTEQAPGFVSEYLSGLSYELDDLADDQDLAEDNLREAETDYAIALATRTTKKERKDRKEDVQSAEARLRNVKSEQRKIRRWISEWTTELSNMT